MSILDWLKSAALLSVTVFLGFGSYLVYTTAHIEKQIAGQASQTFSAANAAIVKVNTATLQIGAAFTSAAQSIDKTEKDVKQTTTQLSGVAVGLQKTVALVNAPCVPGPCGTVSDVGKTLNTARLTMGQVEIATNSFDKNQNHFYTQEDQLYADADGAANRLNVILTSPDLYDSIHNVNTITSNLGQTTTDFQTKFHSFLYPPPCKGFKCWVKNGYEAIKVGSDLLEPSYYGWALLSQIKP
jgi:hypothetical protein